MFSDKIKKLFGFENQKINEQGEWEPVFQFPFIVQSIWSGDNPSIQSVTIYSDSEENAVKHYVNTRLQMKAFSKGAIKIKVFTPTPTAIYEVDGSTKITKLDIDI